MFGIILILATVVVTLLIHILFGRNIRIFNDSFRLLILVIFLICSGIVLILWQQFLISEGFTRHAWPTVKAEVIETGISGERAYNPKIDCRYEVDGITYLLKTDLQTPGFGRKRSRKQTAEIIISRYPVGSKIPIFYNPDKPAEAYIRTGPYWDNYTLLMLGLLTLGAGLLLLMNRRPHFKSN